MEAEIPEEFYEQYEIVRMLDMYSKDGQFRIEIVRVLRGSAGAFHAHYYERLKGAWTFVTGPGWVARDDQESALQQAAIFLKQWSEKRATPAGAG